MSPQKAAGVMRRKDVRSSLRALSEAGYAVIVWTPKELKGVDPSTVEERSIELGSDVISWLK